MFQFCMCIFYKVAKGSMEVSYFAPVWEQISFLKSKQYEKDQHYVIGYDYVWNSMAS